MTNLSVAPHNQTRLTHPKYRADIDGLRAIAILSVVGFHTFPNWFKSGFIGVDIFFVISGFLISSIIFENLERDSFSYKEFYERRIRRIFPALIIVLFASLCFGWYVLLAEEYRQLGKHTAAGTAFVSNFVLWGESGYFDNAAETKPLLHLWSLAIEEQFYIFWPLLLGAVWKWKRGFLAITVAIALISFSVGICTVKSDAVAAFYSPLTRCWELMIGGILAYLTLHKPSLVSKYQNAQSVAGFILLATSLYFINRSLEFPGWWAALPTLGAFFIISAGANARLNKILLSNKIAVWFGLISYPLYLWHWPLLVWPIVTTGNLLSPSARIVLIFISIALAWITYFYVENKVRKGKKRYLSKLVIIIAAIGVFSLCIAGGVIKSRHGSSDLQKILKAKLDWDYPGDQFKRTIDPNLRYFVAHGKKQKTVFIGDSNMEQYAPRINLLLKQNPDIYNTAVVVGNQLECSLILEIIEKRDKCNSTLASLSELVSAEDVSNVVFAANWLSYETALGEDLKYLNFINFIKNIPGNKKFYIILNMPHGKELDPKNMFEGSRFSTLRPKQVDGIKFDTDFFRKTLSPVHEKLKYIAKQTHSIVVDPLDTLCAGNVCPVFDKDGGPLYRDSGHITASYAKASAIFIDETLKSSQIAYPLLPR